MSHTSASAPHCCTQLYQGDLYLRGCRIEGRSRDPAIAAIQVEGPRRTPVTTWNRRWRGCPERTRIQRNHAVRLIGAGDLRELEVAVIADRAIVFAIFVVITDEAGLGVYESVGRLLDAEPREDFLHRFVLHEAGDLRGEAERDDELHDQACAGAEDQLLLASKSTAAAGRPREEPWRLKRAHRWRRDASTGFVASTASRRVDGVSHDGVAAPDGGGDVGAREGCTVSPCQQGCWRGAPRALAHRPA